MNQCFTFIAYLRSHWRNTGLFSIFLPCGLLLRRIRPYSTPTLLYLSGTQVTQHQCPAHSQNSMFRQIQTGTFPRHLKKINLVMVVVVVAVLWLCLNLEKNRNRNETELYNHTAFPCPFLPSGSMTWQESPSTLLHYGKHWWPLDRQPISSYHHHHHHYNSSTLTLASKAGSNTSSYRAPRALWRQ